MATRSKEPRVRRVKSTLGAGTLSATRSAPGGDKRRLGAEAEAIATRLLLDEGYRIVERNFTADLGELDIVARDGDVLVFCEVRSRANRDHGDAVEMVSRTKQRRVARVAALYLEVRKPDYEEARFDVIGITGGEASLVKDAFRLGRY